MFLLSKESEEDTGCHCRTDHARNVRAHRVHQQVVRGVVLPADILGHTGGHGNGGNTGSTGWGGEWNPEISKKCVLRTHSTSLSIQHLAKNPNRVFTRDQLLDEVWGFDYFGDSRTVDVHIKRLREKLDGVSDKWTLKTVWGVGYKFELIQ